MLNGNNARIRDNSLRNSGPNHVCLRDLPYNPTLHKCIYRGSSHILHGCINPLGTAFGYTGEFQMKKINLALLALAFLVQTTIAATLTFSAASDHSVYWGYRNPAAPAGTSQAAQSFTLTDPALIQGISHYFWQQQAPTCYFYQRINIQFGNSSMPNGTIAGNLDYNFSDVCFNSNNNPFNFSNQWVIPAGHYWLVFTNNYIGTSVVQQPLLLYTGASLTGENVFQGNSTGWFDSGYGMNGSILYDSYPTTITGNVNGTVYYYNSTSNYPAGAFVSIYAEEIGNATNNGYGFTNASGIYGFNVSKAGNYTFTWYDTDVWGDNGNALIPIEHHANISIPLTGPVDLSIPAPISFNGTIYDNFGNVTPHQGLISIAAYHGNDSQATNYTYTNNGNYSLRLPYGYYDFVLTNATGHEFYFQNYLVDHSPINFYFNQTVVQSILVLDECIAPMPGVQLVMRTRNATYAIADIAYTDANGRYTLNYSYQNTLYLSAFKQGYFNGTTSFPVMGGTITLCMYKLNDSSPKVRYSFIPDGYRLYGVVDQGASVFWEPGQRSDYEYWGLMLIDKNGNIFYNQTNFNENATNKSLTYLRQQIGNLLIPHYTKLPYYYNINSTIKNYLNIQVGLGNRIVDTFNYNSYNGTILAIVYFKRVNWTTIDTAYKYYEISNITINETNTQPIQDLKDGVDPFGLGLIALVISLGIAAIGSNAGIIGSAAAFMVSLLFFCGLGFIDWGVGLAVSIFTGSLIVLTGVGNGGN